MNQTIVLSLVTVSVLACGPATEQQGSPVATQEATPTAGDASPPAGRGGFPFTDVTAASGIDFVHHNGAAGQRHFPETMGPGLALFDADGDGDLDLYAVNGADWDLAGDAGGGAERPTNRLFRNRGNGSFEDVTEASGAADPGYGMGTAVGDADGDGDLDLYVLNYGANALYLNDGSGHFQRLAAGVEDAGWSVGAAFLDFDGDRDLDLYVVSYLDYVVGREAPCRAGPLSIYCSPEPFAPAPDRLYRNDSDADGVRFVEVSRQAGITVDGRGMGLAVSDLDEDGDADVYITNDRSANLLYRNQGGRFEEVAAEAGLGYGATGQIEGGMGAIAADFTGSGLPAIFLTNFHKEPNRFFVAAGQVEGGDAANRGDAPLFFDDHSLSSGLGFPSYETVSWGIGAIDVEGDGDLDLAVANGHVFDNAAELVAGSAFHMPDQLFVNDGHGFFATREFPGPPLSSRGVATGDLDGDGDRDLAIASCAGRLRIWRNQAGRPERFLIVELRDLAPNVHAYGARLTAWIGDRRLVREVAGGGSYGSHGETRIDLGLGEAGKVDRLAVRWPDGSVEETGEVGGGQLVVWSRGEGLQPARPLASGR